MAKYDLDAHARGLFPWFWQNDPNLSLIDVLIGGCFDTVNDAYGAAEIDYRQKVGYSIQRLSLEESLNDRFDDTLRRITVENGQSVSAGFVYNEVETIDDAQQKFVFNEAESLPTGADEVFFLNNGETTGETTTGFFVTCPLAISGDEDEIIAWIEFVQVTGTEYTLTFI